DCLGEEEAGDEHQAERHERLDQPRAKLDQVIEQRRFGGLDVLVRHAARPPAGGAAASGAAVSAGGVPGAASCVTTGSAGVCSAGAGNGSAAGADAACVDELAVSVVDAAFASVGAT